MMQERQKTKHHERTKNIAMTALAFFSTGIFSNHHECFNKWVTVILLWGAITKLLNYNNAFFSSELTCYIIFCANGDILLYKLINIHYLLFSPTLKTLVDKLISDYWYNQRLHKDITNLYHWHINNIRLHKPKHEEVFSIFRKTHISKYSPVNSNISW